MPTKQKKVNKPIYLLDHKLKWRTFKELQNRLVRDSGPVPVEGDKALWHLLRDRKIYCWFDFEKLAGDMGVGLELPQGRDIKLITNYANQTKKRK